MLSNDIIDTLEDDSGSDTEIIEAIMKFNKMTFEILPPKIGGYKKGQSGFFPYTNKTPIDLSRYDIYDEVKSSNYKDNCFITALISAEVDENIITQFKEFENMIDECLEGDVATKETEKSKSTKTKTFQVVDLQQLLVGKKTPLFQLEN